MKNLSKILKNISFFTAFIFIFLIYPNVLNAQTPGLSYFLNDDGTAYIVSKGTASAASVVIPDSYNGLPVTYIYDFEDYRTMTSIIIPNSVTGIHNYAFAGTGLISVTIPASVTGIGAGIFLRCSSLTSINVNSNNPVLSSQDGILYDKDKTLLLHAPGAIRSVTIPNSVTHIYNNAFYGCIGLMNITIPNSVTGIGNGAFYGTGLTSVTIPASVTSIGAGMFGSCSSLTRINVDSNNPVLSSQDGILYDKDKTVLIQAPGAIKSVTIPNSVTIIYHYAFSDCTGLTSVTIPDSVTDIGERAFYFCTGLTSITIGNSISAIYGYAFIGCLRLDTLIIMATTPPEIIGSEIISGSPLILVPQASVNLYRVASGWSKYSFLGFN